jgi:hypothetical protein
VTEVTACLWTDSISRYPYYNIRETIMSKREEKREQKSPAKPDSIAKDAELSEEQLKEVSGGSITRKIDIASPNFFKNC